jgi:hypothetical protein
MKLTHAVYGGAGKMKKEIPRQNRDWPLPADQVDSDVSVMNKTYDYSSKTCVANLNKYVQELKAFLDSVRKAKADATPVASKPIKRKTQSSRNAALTQKPNSMTPSEPSKSHRC